jgi:hypothetical protein
MNSVTVRRWLVLAFVTLGVVRGAAAQDTMAPPASGYKTAAAVDPPPGAPAALPAAAPMPAAAPAPTAAHAPERKEGHEAKDAHKEEHHEAHEEEHEHEHECECEEGKWFFSADYLLMQPRRRALDFAISDPNRDGRPQGIVESVFPDADSGVRVGGGYKVGEHGWELGTYYTYFYSAAQRTVTAPPGGTLYATLTHPGFVDAVDTAVGKTSFKYQIFDAEFGKHLEAGEDCAIYLSAGFRYAWIDQALDANYDGQSAFLSRVRSPISFDGPGLRAGADGEWKINHHVGVYANAHGSLISGEFRSRLTETNNAGAAVITQISERFRKVVPEADLGLGLAFHWERFQARLGYEITNWFGMVDSPDFIHDFTNKLGHRTGDLSLDGLRLQLLVDF